MLGPDGQYRRWQTEDPEHLNERRAAIALPVEDEPAKIDPTAQARAEYREWLRGYEDWLCSAG
jgi:hypothetical protein